VCDSNQTHTDLLKKTSVASCKFDLSGKIAIISLPGFTGWFSQSSL